MRYFLIIVVACLISSCHVTKKYERPDMDEVIPLSYKNSHDQDTTNIARVGWHEYFNETQLIDYIQEGLENNYDLKTAIGRIDMARWRMGQANLGSLPDLNGNIGVGHNNGTLIGRDGASYSAGLTLSWELDLWGGIKSTKKEKLALYLQQIETKQSVEISLIADIASAYYRLIALDKQLDIAQKNYQLRIENLKTVSLLKEAGLLNGVNESQAEALMLNSKALITDLESRIDIQENALSILLGHSGRKLPRNKMLSIPKNHKWSIGVPSQLLRLRPDVRAAEFALKAAWEQENIAKTNLYPNITISGSSGLNATSITSWFSSQSLFSSVSGAISQPIFNRRNLKMKHKVAEFTKREKLYAFQKQLLISSNEVSNALSTLTSEEKMISTKLLERNASENSLEQSQKLLRQGMINYIDVLTSQIQLLTVEMDLVDHQLNYHLAKIQLYKSLGGGEHH